MSAVSRVAMLDETDVNRVLFTLAAEHPGLVAAVLDRVVTCPDNSGQSLGRVTIDRAGQGLLSNVRGSNGQRVGNDRVRTHQSLSSQG